MPEAHHTPLLLCQKLDDISVDLASNQSMTQEETHEQT